jgi:hypothetical protein
LKKQKRKKNIDQASVDAFSKKLAEWGKTLPKKEAGLLRLLVDRATSVNVGDLGDYNLTAKVQPDAERVFKGLQKSIARMPRGPVWVRLGPLWLRSNTTLS